MTDEVPKIKQTRDELNAASPNVINQRYTCNMDTRIVAITREHTKYLWKN